MRILLLLVVMVGVSSEPEAGVGNVAAINVSALVLHTYEARIRVDGRVSATQVKANDAGHAKKLVQTQFGPSVTVLSVKRVD